MGSNNYEKKFNPQTGKWEETITYTREAKGQKSTSPLQVNPLADAPVPEQKIPRIETLQENLATCQIEYRNALAEFYAEKVKNTIAEIDSPTMLTGLAKQRSKLTMAFLQNQQLPELRNNYQNAVNALFRAEMRQNLDKAYLRAENYKNICQESFETISEDFTPNQDWLTKKTAEATALKYPASGGINQIVAAPIVDEITKYINTLYFYHLAQNEYAIVNNAFLIVKEEVDLEQQLKVRRQAEIDEAKLPKKREAALKKLKTPKFYEYETIADEGLFEDDAFLNLVFKDKSPVIISKIPSLWEYVDTEKRPELVMKHYKNNPNQLYFTINYAGDLVHRLKIDSIPENFRSQKKLSLLAVTAENNGKDISHLKKAIELHFTPQNLLQ